MAEINNWDVTAANNNDTPPDGWPENTMQYSEVNNTGREGMAVMARYFQDSNGSLITGGPANTYTLATNAAHTSYFAGMYLAAQFNATNTGAVTLNVNAIGPQAVLDRSGGALAGGIIQSGGIYELRYDGTNFQLMGTLGATAVVGSGLFTNTNAPDLVDTNVALNVGSATPDSNQHIEVGPSQIQSKSNATTAADLNINALGGNVIFGGGGFFNNRLRATVSGAPNQMELIHTGNTETRYNVRNTGGGTSLAVLPTGFARIVQTNAAGTQEDVWIDLNRNSGVALRYNGAEKFTTGLNGVEVTGGINATGTILSSTTATTMFEGDGSVNASARRLLLRNNQGGVEYLVNTDGSLRVGQMTPGGVFEKIWLRGIRNGSATLFHNNSEKLATSADGIDITGAINFGNNDWLSYTDSTNTYLFNGDAASPSTTVDTTTIQTGRLRLTSTSDASDSSTGHAFQVGDTSGLNVIIDNNEIMFRSNGSTISAIIQDSFYHQSTARLTVTSTGATTNGQHVATSFNATSARKHKTKIKNIQHDCLDLLDKLQPKQYEWKKGFEGFVEGVHFGFIADDVENHCPELVTHDGEGEVSGMNYQNMIALLWEQNQLLKKRIEKLEG